MPVKSVSADAAPCPVCRAGFELALWWINTATPAAKMQAPPRPAPQQQDLESYFEIQGHKSCGGGGFTPTICKPIGKKELTFRDLE